MLYLHLMSFLRLKIQVSKLGVEMNDIDFSKSLNVLQFIKTYTRLHLAHSLVSGRAPFVICGPHAPRLGSRQSIACSPSLTCPSWFTSHMKLLAHCSVQKDRKRKDLALLPKASFSGPMAADPGQHWELKGSLY